MPTTNTLPPGFRQDLDDAEAITPLSLTAILDVARRLRIALAPPKIPNGAIAGRGAVTLAEALQTYGCPMTERSFDLEPDSWIIVELADAITGRRRRIGYHGAFVHEELERIARVPA